jgi:hypothetical protein
MNRPSAPELSEEDRDRLVWECLLCSENNCLGDDELEFELNHPHWEGPDREVSGLDFDGKETEPQAALGGDIATPATSN